MSALKNIFMVGAVCAAMMGGAAFATPMEIQLQSGGQTFSMTGSSPALTYSQAIGNFTTTVNTGTSSAGPALDLSSVEIISGGAGGTLVVTLSENQLSGPVGTNWLSQFSGNFLTGTSTVSLKTYIDYSNLLLGTGTLLGNLSANTTPFALSSINSALSPTGLYALTEVLTITSSGNSHISLDGSVTNVPEPNTLIMLATALIGLGLIRRRRRAV